MEDVCKLEARVIPRGCRGSTSLAFSAVSVATAVAAALANGRDRLHHASPRKIWSHNDEDASHFQMNVRKNGGHDNVTRSWARGGACFTRFRTGNFCSPLVDAGKASLHDVLHGVDKCEPHRAQCTTPAHDRGESQARVVLGSSLSVELHGSRLANLNYKQMKGTGQISAPSR
jgi:hypothetical protein